MKTFALERPRDVASAIALAASGPAGATADNRADTQFIAGGTTLLDLMKLGSLAPRRLIDINALAREIANVSEDGERLRLGALARMERVARDARVSRRAPMIAQSLSLAASPQLRNMASLGGNVLQRTRCQYFRDPSWANCEKRNPGSGCAALDGVNRKHAVLGVGDRCIAAYPGDFAVALVAADATVEIAGPRGTRSAPFESLHVEASTPGAPEVETTLKAGDLITGFAIPAPDWLRRSVYIKVRDRESYEFALASAAVALDLDGGRVREARVALGGVAYKPWRAREAEAALVGKTIDESVAEAAARAAFANARPRDGNAFKVELGQRTLARAVMAAATMEI